MGSAAEDFTARVKCFPLYSTLLAARAQHADFLSLACGGCEMAVLESLPHSQVLYSLLGTRHHQENLHVWVLLLR